MKLWILRPVDGAAPWEPWFDCMFGYVIRGQPTKRGAWPHRTAGTRDQMHGSCPVSRLARNCRPTVRRGSSRTSGTERSKKNARSAAVEPDRLGGSAYRVCLLNSCPAPGAADGACFHLTSAACVATLDGQGFFMNRVLCGLVALGLFVGEVLPD
jgi:hypothetical protein